jgi:acyl carrier protein
MTDERDDIEQRVRECIATTMHLEPGKVTAASTFAELGIDSLDGINIVFAIEDTFGVEVPDDAAKDIRSVGDLIGGVRRLVEQKSSGA